MKVADDSEMMFFMLTQAAVDSGAEPWRVPGAACTLVLRCLARSEDEAVVQYALKASHGFFFFLYFC